MQLTGYDAMYYSLNGAVEKRYAAPIGNFISPGIYTLKNQGIWINLAMKSGKEIHICH